jgi:hypothetical protein
MSDILSQESIGTVHIDKIEWQALSGAEKNLRAKNANYTAQEPVMHEAVITGRIDVPEDNYRESVNYIQRIIEYTKANPRVDKVDVLLMPVDVRSESKFTTESGLNIKQNNSKAATGVFSLRIKMKAANNV